MKLRGVISLRKALPICAIPKRILRSQYRRCFCNSQRYPAQFRGVGMQLQVVGKRSDFGLEH